MVVQIQKFVNQKQIKESLKITNIYINCRYKWTMPTEHEGAILNRCFMTNSWFFKSRPVKSDFIL